MLLKVSHNNNPHRGTQRTSLRCSALKDTATSHLEGKILSALQTAKGRGKEGISSTQLNIIVKAVDELEALGIPSDPVLVPALEGRWKLLFTTRPGSASPIQRAFTGVDSFSVFQEIYLQGRQIPTTSSSSSFDPTPRVNNVVEFGSLGELRVEAVASTDSNPVPGFVPRSGDGGFFGLYPFGKSISTPPSRANMRLDFQFDQAAFAFENLPFKIPYPVPFRILGDEAKGWIDVTYLSPSGQFRLSRGNKGTLFILQKEG